MLSCSLCLIPVKIFFPKKPLIYEQVHSISHVAVGFTCEIQCLLLKSIKLRCNGNFYYTKIARKIFISKQIIILRSLDRANESAPEDMNQVTLVFLAMLLSDI